jgi:hypothetical protein
VVVPLDVQLGDGQEHVRSQPDIERGPCSLRVEDLENMPAGSPYIMAPNHVSYLDAFAVAAALDYSVLRCTYWAGAAFGHTLTRLVSTGLRCSSPIFAGSDVQSCFTGRRTAWRQGSSSRGSTSARM